MNTSQLSAQHQSQLKEVYQKACDTVLKHDVKYLAHLDSSFFDKMLTSPDESVRYLGQYAKLLHRYLIDCWHEDYKSTWKITSAFTAALLYIVNPWDLIPDTVSELGYLDDLYVLELALSNYDSELDKYVEAMNIDRAEFDAIWE